jgi:hypothetical protein
MRSFAISVMSAALLAVAAPRSVLGVDAGPGEAGHVGGVASGVGGSFGLDNPAARLEADGIDRTDRFEHGGMLGLRDHVNERFDFPVCFAHPYCPSPLFPCGWQGAGHPSVDADSAQTAYGEWGPSGCY